MMYVLTRWKIPIKEELTRICDFNFEIFILDKMFEELKGKKDEKLTREIAKNFKIIKTNEGRVDDLLFEMKDSIIATQDRELKKRLKQNDIGIITIRQKKYLVLEN